MAYSSSVPAAITALIAAFTASAQLGAAGVPVQDGPQLAAATALEAVAVGYSGDQNQAAATGTATPEGLGPPDRERYAITCVAEVLDPGGNLPAAARTRAYQLHAACGAAVNADRTLGGTVLRAVPGPGTLTQKQTENGALARIVFPVTVDAYTVR